MQDLIEDKSKIFSKNTIICLGIIGLAGFLIRLFYFPDGIPITLDGATYFWYANDLSVSGTFPNNVDLVNNGWPTFMSVFFSLFNSENILDYMDSILITHPKLARIQKRDSNICLLARN